MGDRTIQLPEKVGRIIGTLQEHGYEAYAVGGCIRDSILGREPEDWDITTSAMPEETKALFDKTFDTGIQHGTITVLLEKEGSEGSYLYAQSPGRSASEGFYHQCDGI